MRRTTTLALTAALAAALAVPTTGAALAAPKAKPTTSPTATATAEPTATPTEAPTATPTAVPTATATQAPVPRITRGARGAKNVLVVHGTVSAVDATAGTLTITVRGGRDKKLRGTEFTVTVAEGAKVVRDDAPAELAEITVGDRVNVKGTRGTDGPVATRISAGSGEDGGEPTETPTAEPTAEPTATPTAEPTATPTAEPTAGPTATPTAGPTATPTAEPTATPTA
ncbi:hypothetical protein [Kineococcus sp. G2]|uniref:hypothetical protein n=1 Tax=Kineococcus sp. G2 TaxID=3127484 RepID=UPI00301BB339